MVITILSGLSIVISHIECIVSALFWGVLGEMSFDFFSNTFFPEKLEFNKKQKHLSYIVQSWCIYQNYFHMHHLFCECL